MNKILKFTLTSFINYNLIFSGCCKKSKNKNEKKSSCCQKEDKNNENFENNSNDEDSNNKNKDNKEIHDFSSIKETHLKDLNNIIYINQYLNNGLNIDKNLLENEIEEINSKDKANILNTKLNKFKIELLNKIKKQYQETLINIINNLNLLKNSGNFNIDKIVIDVKNEDIDNLKFENINDIESINNKILSISKKYEDFITEIINNLKSKYNNLKPNDTDNNLDVKNEEFDNLENDENKIEKIISINNKLRTAEQVINNDVEGMKNDIIKLFSELKPKEEKIKQIVKDADSIFDLSVNIKDKLNDNIKDLKNIKTNLENLKTEFYSILNKKKIEIDKRCKIINNVKNNINTEFNENFEDLKIDKYDENNFEVIDKKVKAIEEEITAFIDNKVKELNEKEKNLKLKFKKLKLTYKDIKIAKKSNTINDYYDYLIEYNNELDYRNCKIEFYININEPKKNEYDFKKIIKKFKKLKYSYSEKCDKYPYISFTIGKENYFQNFIDEFKTCENGVQFYIKDNGKISKYGTDNLKKISLKDYDIYFIYNDKFKKGTSKKNIAEDAGGLRKTIFKNMKDDIFKNESLFKIKSKLANLNTVPKNNINCTATYYEFNNDSNENNEIYYKILGYICAASLRSHKGACGINLKLNPLIYKIILNYKDIDKDINEKLDEKKEKIKKILTYDDFKYFDPTYFIYFYKLQTDTLEEYKMLFEKDYIDTIRGKYNEMIENFANQIDNIKVFVKNLLKYLNYDIFNKCGTDYIKLKLLIEGEDKITYEDLISKIIKFEEINEEDLCLNTYSNENLKLIYELIIEVLNNFSEDDLKLFVIFVTGNDSLPIKDSSIKFAFTTNNTPYGFNSHTCFNRLDINPQKLVEGIFKGSLKDDKICDNLKKDLKKRIEEYLKASIHSVDTKALDAQ